MAVREAARLPASAAVLPPPGAGDFDATSSKKSFIFFCASTVIPQEAFFPELGHD